MAESKQRLMMLLSMLLLPPHVAMLEAQQDNIFGNTDNNNTLQDDQTVDTAATSNTTIVVQEQQNITGRDDGDEPYWQCDENYWRHLDFWCDTPYLCRRQVQQDDNVLHASLLLLGQDSSLSLFFSLHACHVNLTEQEEPSSNQQPPTSAVCDSCCMVMHYNASSDTWRDCNLCSTAENGNVTYDCSNVFPDAACPERDATGHCHDYASWQCRDLRNGNATHDDGLSAPYMCLDTSAKQPPSVDASLPPLTALFLCDVPQLDAHAVEQHCQSACVLFNQDSLEWCNACHIVDADMLAYDCSNLYPNAPCPAKDALGVCYEDSWTHWQCLPLGLGYQCIPMVMEEGFPVRQDFIIDPEISVLVYCSNDITGRPVQDCQDSTCGLFRAYDSDCQSCRVLSPEEDDYQGLGLAYDCSNLLLNLTCSIRHENGTCTTTTAASTNFVVDNDAPRDAPLNAAETTEKDTTRTWVLKNMDPTTFNVVSDLFATVTTALIATTIASLYPLFMTWKIKLGMTTVPISEIGQMPGNVWSAAKALRSFSVPALALVLLLMAADYSHTIADSGLNFVTVQTKGPDEHVLVVATDKRNPARPMQTAGDPPLIRTMVFPTLSKRIGASNYQDTDATVAVRQENAVLSAYMSAVLEMARGGSPHASEISTKRERVDLVYGNVEGFFSFFVPGDLPLVEMKDTIALDCASDEMVVIRQYSVGPLVYERPIEHTATVPNCTWTSARQSGIYGTGGDSFQILEWASRVVANTVWTAPDTPDLFLRNGTKTFQSFQARPESKLLARDRSDWRKGREFFEVDGVAIGDISIDLGRVVLSSGVDNGPTEREYYLFAEVLGNCPPRPSGLSAESTACMVFVELNCETFAEDFETYHPIYAPLTESSECYLKKMDIVWGRNFVVDAELVSLVAGLAGTVQPKDHDFSYISFPYYGMFAALLALGKVEKRPSIQVEVRPEVNVVYITFMLLPLALSIAIHILVRRYGERAVNVPKSRWDLMVLGKESSLIPTREAKRGPYPENDNDLVLEFFDAQENARDEENESPDHTIVRKSTILRPCDETGGASKNDEIKELPHIDETERVDQNSEAPEESLPVLSQETIASPPIDTKAPIEPLHGLEGRETELRR